MTGPIFIFSGSPASGKTTVSRALLQNFPFGLHNPVDTIRNWVVAGLSDPIGGWDEETARQFGLARHTAAMTAQLYAGAGFAVVIDDLVIPEHVAAHYEDALLSYEVHKVLLKPSLEITLVRNAQRDDPNKKLLEDVIKRVDEAFALERFDWTGWQVIDSSELSVEKTVRAILERTGYSALLSVL
jgi:tRNA uridine 5-carbamoylmethylation protein Kti12